MSLNSVNRILNKSAYYYDVFGYRFGHPTLNIDFQWLLQCLVVLFDWLKWTLILGSLDKRSEVQVLKVVAEYWWRSCVQKCFLVTYSFACSSLSRPLILPMLLCVGMLQCGWRAETGRVTPLCTGGKSLMPQKCETISYCSPTPYREPRKQTSNPQKVWR